MSGSRRRGRERVTRGDVPLIETRLEPVDALLRRAVRERVRDDRASRLPLQPIVADGARSSERLVDVAGLEPVVARLGAVRPDAREAIGLQLQPNGQARRALHALAVRPRLL